MQCTDVWRLPFQCFHFMPEKTINWVGFGGRGTILREIFVMIEG